MAMTIAVPRETHPGERRVAATPDTVAQLLKLGYAVEIETGAGALASFDDNAYRAAGATVVSDTHALWSNADVVIKVRPPSLEEAQRLKPGATLIGFVWPAQNPALLEAFAARNATALAMDCVPRISRAQKLDALSSMANMAGYRAVIEAAQHFGRLFTGQITAAGKMPPAKVLVIGAGVAGLAAIGAARGLGAIVRAFDTRPEVAQQVESMGAEFLQVDADEEGGGAGGYAKQMSAKFIEAEMALFEAQARDVDIIITTALIPGKPAPRLITAQTAALMRAGSVIVDMAAEQGGNCELTRANEVVNVGGVTVVGYTDLPSRMATQSSQLYATNVRHLLTDLTPAKDGELKLDMDDVVQRGTTVVQRGALCWPPAQPAPQPTPAKPAAEAQPPAIAAAGSPLDAAARARRRGAFSLVALAVAAVGLLALGAVAPPSFVAHLTVFVLAVFVGYQVVWNVTPALHTPLMSVTNAISGIIVIGALLRPGSTETLVSVLAGVALLVATINIAGGFLVTQRMLKMFQRT
ncbi:Re/Si-specific NAD(P)(+) transhydrogenase subunit alpha [Paraburkholderia caballeronis]|uniref:NAD(P) transhydrogenase subunit alpha n=1 Tax=Paraburkholderia caballeronis TaxID=416943 RepID=A0A1H7K2N4_9BURK|nr:Re/Si-specific NAD(P)(+) transhydrogenase subunit alpha [Paraburkholderia caballeronis]PXW27190.1 NAD(P) transhydrogenase alpha subunit [Paraburkholderia caballeronis]PXX02664.1 NAD(P) transhydrogenase alpha subunit [Paraburkholderia caballeronis]RAK03389.1 NAD(P) transhydrogenase alpha subunit [Paraburkholderia caballeronis]SEC43883.1 NAD(P) transhydrogenase subunit alpha [Paraburkholderia caballeronis]SEK80145.1 NAD(P) transhydrogenase subunit alpha [Paraburkholderia caballeronis]